MLEQEVHIWLMPNLGTEGRRSQDSLIQESGLHGNLRFRDRKPYTLKPLIRLMS